MRGYVTLAIGDEYYYQLASNMLRSYKLYNKNNEYSFAILCDRENKYTKEFDNVIVINTQQNSYTSKFELLKYAPYDENIFIEPDCLIYRDISELWEMLAKGDDFNAFGWNDGDLEVWFTEKIKKQYRIKTIPIFNPGYLFIRPGKVCEKIYDDLFNISKYLIENKQEYPKCFVGGNILRDDPVLAIAMKLNNCKCPAKPKEGKLLSLPSEKLICVKISNGYLETERCKKGNLLHFSTKKTRQGLYLQQKIVMNLMWKDAPKWKIGFVENKIVLEFLEVYCKCRNFFKGKRK